MSNKDLEIEDYEESEINEQSKRIKINPITYPLPPVSHTLPPVNQMLPPVNHTLRPPVSHTLSRPVNHTLPPLKLKQRDLKPVKLPPLSRNEPTVEEENSDYESSKGNGVLLLLITRSLVITVLVVTVIIISMCFSASVLLLTNRQVLALQISLQSLQQDLLSSLEEIIQSIKTLESSLNQTKQSLRYLESNLIHTRRSIAYDFESSLNHTRRSVLQSLDNSLIIIRYNHSILNHIVSSFMVQTLESVKSLESSFNDVRNIHSILNQSASQNKREFIAYKQLANSLISSLESSINDLRLNHSSVKQVTISHNREKLDYKQHVGNLSSFLFKYFKTSCQAVRVLEPGSGPGFYLIRTSIGTFVRVYCEMTVRACGGIAGGWMRLIDLDITDTYNRCPSGFRERYDRNRRSCVISREPCSSNTFNVSHIYYSRVCGMIKAYQVGSPDAFHGGNGDIDGPYVDGVSITSGSPRRQHIWTFAASNTQNLNLGGEYSSCPCLTSSTHISFEESSLVPSFVRNDYFCDSGNRGTPRQEAYFGFNPLWDGAGCTTIHLGSDIDRFLFTDADKFNFCCVFNHPPWFDKQLQHPSTDNIEMRVCRDQSEIDEDITIEYIALYVL